MCDSMLTHLRDWGPFVSSKRGERWHQTEHVRNMAKEFLERLPEKGARGWLWKEKKKGKKATWPICAFNLLV